MMGLKHIISKDMYRKARAPIFVLTIFLMTITLIYPQRTQGGETYTYTHKNGIKVISNIPISEKYESKAQKTDSFNTMTPSKRRTLENENKAKQRQYKKEREERGKLLLLYSIFK